MDGHPNNREIRNLSRVFLVVFRCMELPDPVLSTYMHDLIESSQPPMIKVLLISSVFLGD